MAYTRVGYKENHKKKEKNVKRDEFINKKLIWKENNTTNSLNKYSWKIAATAPWLAVWKNKVQVSSQKSNPSHWMRNHTYKLKPTNSPHSGVKSLSVGTIPKNLSTNKREWEGDPGGYWWPPAYSTWTPTIVSFNFLVSLIVAQLTFYGSFLGPELPESFWGPKRRFFGKT